MGHKRYVVKNGKVYGPYLYHSYREDGKVKKRYLGKHEDFKKGELLSFSFFVAVGIFSLGMLIKIILQKLF